MLGSLLTFFAVGLITLVVASVVLWVGGVLIGSALGLASFLLLKVAPILLVGWIVVKLIERRKRGGYLSEADRRWLEGE